MFLSCHVAFRVNLHPNGWVSGCGFEFRCSHLDIYVYKYNDDYIWKGLFQSICLITIIIWLNFLLKVYPYLHQFWCHRQIIISEYFLDIKIVTDFYLLQYIDLDTISDKTKFLR